MQKDFQLTVDIENKIRTPSFEVNTLDLKTVRLQITIIQGRSLVDLTGITVRMSIQKPDKNVLFQDCEVINARAGLVEIVLDNQAYLLPGKYIAELMCFQGAEVVAVTGSFSYTSTKGILTDEAVESKSEFTAITGMVKHAQETLDDLRANGTAIDAQAREEASISLNTLSSMRDPLAYLNSIEVLCSFPARGNSTTTWMQGFSINEQTNELYASFQENEGTYLRIEIRDLNGRLKGSKTLPIQAGAYTENLPFFYNDAKQLCFIVRTENVSSYAIYNYQTGELSAPVPINGNRAKGDVDGNYFVTCDTTSSAPYTLRNVFIYDWRSIKNRTPYLVNSFRVDHHGDLVEKAQGIVLNNGYIFLPQGGSNGNPALTVFNTAGRLMNAYLYKKESLADAINEFNPGAIADRTNYAYENESGCKYQGKLAVAQILNGTVYICIHNSPLGIPLETDVPVYKNDTGWEGVTFLNNAESYGSETTPRIRRIGNQVILTGAVKGLTTHVSLEVLSFNTALKPDRHFQFSSVTSSGHQCNWQVSNNGTLRLLNTKHPSPDNTTWYPFHVSWFI